MTEIMKKNYITMFDGSRQELHTRLMDSEAMSTGSCWCEAKDGGLIMFMGRRGKPMAAYKTYDNGITVAEEWEIGEGASENMIRLKDGRIMSINQQQTDNILGNDLKASNFYAYFSEDDGHTFGNRVTISAENRRLYLMNARVMRLSTGRIIVPTCIHPNHLLEEKLETVGWVGAFWSDDEGQTWQEGEWKAPVKVDQLCEPIVCEMADGSLKMYVRTGVGYLYQLDSKDGGATWSDEYPTTLRSPCAPFTFSYDPYGEQYVCVWDNSFPGPVHQYPRTPICLAVSKDCKTWTQVCELGNDPMGSYGYPAVWYTPDSLMMSYYISDVRKFSDRNRVHLVWLKRNTHPLLASNRLAVRIFPEGKLMDVPTHVFKKETASTVSEMIDLNDGSLLVVSQAGNYTTTDGGRSFAPATGSFGCNLLRLKDGRLLGIDSRKCLEPRGARLNGGNFWATFSDDEGKTFGGHVPITTRDGCYYIQNSRYFRTSSGRILSPLCLHDASELDRKLETAGWVTCFYSDDEGQTWTEGPWVKPETDQLCECMVAEMREAGHIKMISRTARGYLYQCDSFDDGKTWTEERPTELKSPCAPFTFKYDPYSDLYMVLHDNSFPSTTHQYPRSPMSLSVSKDGEHWETLMDVGSEQDCSYGYPAMYFTENEIYVTHYRSTERAFGNRNRVHFTILSRELHEKLKNIR